MMIVSCSRFKTSVIDVTLRGPPCRRLTWMMRSTAEATCWRRALMGGRVPPTAPHRPPLPAVDLDDEVDGGGHLLAERLDRQLDPPHRHHRLDTREGVARGVR